MEFVTVCDVSDVPQNQMIKVSLEGKQILLANLDGAYYAITNKCSHLGASLAKGSLDGNVVTCRSHGAQFDLTTGAALGKAKIAMLKMPVKDLESYQVKVEEGKILLGMPG
jgi:3-phenylpropionate/trans-cinnamate dioxygenase ferredoxin subunit